MASIFIPESCQRTWEGDAILYCRGASSQSKHGKKTFAELGAKQETFSSWKRKGVCYTHFRRNWDQYSQCI